MDLKLFGGFQLIDEAGQPVTIPARKAKALLAWLAMHPEQNHPRDRLALLLWEESGDTQARHSLRQALSSLRKALGEQASALISDQENVCLLGNRIQVDALRFDALLTQPPTDTLEQAVDLVGGEFLEGFNPRSETFEEWLMLQRSHYREQTLSAMSRLLDHYLQSERLEQGVRLAIRLLGLDPLQERAHRILMQLYNRLNRPADALRQYRQCRRVLFRELNVTPEPETEQLFREIRRQRDQHSNTLDTDPPPPDRPAPGTHPLPSPTVSASSPRLRAVTVVHLHLADYARLLEEQDPESLHHYLGDLTDRVQQQAQHYGGSLQHHHGDALVVLFGLDRTRGTEGEQALRFALEMVSDTAGKPHPGCDIQAGIAAGNLVHAGEQSVSGQVLSLAERLALRAAPGTVWLTEACYRALRLDVAAMQQETAVWQVTGITPGRSSPPTRPPLVGRSRELRQLGSALAACLEDGTGETFLLRGEAGIGKSRLVEELADQAKAQGMPVHQALVLDFGMDIRSEPIPSLLRQLLDLDESATAEQINTRIATCLTIDWPEGVTQPVVHALFRLPLESGMDESIADPLSDQARSSFSRQLISDLLESACRKAPRLLIVEDIHWADPTTLALLAELANAASRCAALLVITSRVEGEPLDPQWRSAMHGAPLTTLDLSPLPDSQAQRLAASLAAPDTPFVHDCIRRAGGNPFFLEQLLLGGETDTQQVPDSVQSLVLARLDLLPESDRFAAQAASILGQRFGLEALTSLLGDPDYRPDALLTQRIVRPEGNRYLFNHALLRDAIYASLLTSQRHELHRQAADWYRQRDPLLTARHLDLAQAPDAAEAYLTASQDAVHRFDFPQALWLAVRGGNISHDPALTARLQIQQGDLQLQSGAISEANHAFEAAHQAACDNPTRCRALIGLATGLTVLDDLDSALEKLQQAGPLAEQSNDLALQTELNYRQGDILFALGRADECLQAHRKAEQLAHSADSPLLQIRAWAGLADAHYARGQMKTARLYFDRCIQRAREVERLPQELGNLSMRGLTRFYSESVTAALEDEFESARLAADYGNLRAEMTAQINLALIYLYTPHIEKAEQAGRAGLELAQRLGATRFYSDTLAAIGEALVLQGKVDEGLDCLEQAYQAALDSVPTHTAAFVLGVLARLTPDDHRRQQAIREGHQLLDQGSLSHNYLHFYQNLIDVSLSRNDPAGARHYADALERYTAEEPLVWSDFYLQRGRLLATAQDSGIQPALQADANRLIATAGQLGLHFGLAELIALRDG